MSLLQAVTAKVGMLREDRRLGARLQSGHVPSPLALASRRAGVAAQQATESFGLDDCAGGGVNAVLRSDHHITEWEVAFRQSCDLLQPAAQPYGSEHASRTRACP